MTIPRDNLMSQHFSHLYHRLLAAEEAVLARGGNVLRLAGLYNDMRGPHSYWLKQTINTAQSEISDGATAAAVVLPTNANGIVNLLHYEDAARAVVAVARSEGSVHYLLQVRVLSIFLRIPFVHKLYVCQDIESKYF